MIVEALPGADAARALGDLLGRLDERQAGGKQLHFELRDGSSLASVVLSLEKLHDFDDLRRELAQAGLRVREGIGAVSAIGTGINAAFGNVRAALLALAELETPILGLSTSSFRISLLLEESRVADAVRRLHERLVESDPVL